MEDDGKRTRSSFVETATTSDGQKEANQSDQWKATIEQQGPTRQTVGRLRADVYVKRRWERVAAKQMCARTLLEEATKAVQLETISSRQSESPCKEESELRHPLEDYIGGFIEAREEAVQLVVCGMRRPVRLEDPEQSLDLTG